MSPPSSTFLLCTWKIVFPIIWAVDLIEWLAIGFREFTSFKFRVDGWNLISILSLDSICNSFVSNKMICQLLLLFFFFFEEWQFLLDPNRWRTWKSTYQVSVRPIHEHQLSQNEIELNPICEFLRFPVQNWLGLLLGYSFSQKLVPRHMHWCNTPHQFVSTTCFFQILWLLQHKSILSWLLF